MKLNIKEISAIATYPVRNPVLRKGKPVESCHFEGDDLETTKHFGLLDETLLIGVISIFEAKNNLFSQEKQFQIRGMAILEAHQKKGFGEILVKHAELYVKSQNGNLIWFNARINAVGFYEKSGYQIIGNSFDIADVGTHYILFKKM